jgi:hypothetical protein
MTDAHTNISQNLETNTPVDGTPVVETTGIQHLLDAADAAETEKILIVINTKNLKDFLINKIGTEDDGTEDMLAVYIREQLQREYYNEEDLNDENSLVVITTCCNITPHEISAIRESHATKYIIVIITNSTFIKSSQIIPQIRSYHHFTGFVFFSLVYERSDDETISLYIDKPDVHQLNSEEYRNRIQFHLIDEFQINDESVDSNEYIDVLKDITLYCIYNNKKLKFIELYADETPSINLSDFDPHESLIQKTNLVSTLSNLFINLSKIFTILTNHKNDSNWEDWGDDIDELFKCIISHKLMLENPSLPREINFTGIRTFGVLGESIDNFLNQHYAGRAPPPSDLSLDLISNLSDEFKEQFISNGLITDLFDTTSLNKVFKNIIIKLSIVFKLTISSTLELSRFNMYTSTMGNLLTVDNIVKKNLTSIEPMLRVMLQESYETVDVNIFNDITKYYRALFYSLVYSLIYQDINLSSIPVDSEYVLVSTEILINNLKDKTLLSSSNRDMEIKFEILNIPVEYRLIRERNEEQVDDEERDDDDDDDDDDDEEWDNDDDDDDHEEHGDRDRVTHEVAESVDVANHSVEVVEKKEEDTSTEDHSPSMTAAQLIENIKNAKFRNEYKKAKAKIDMAISYYEEQLLIIKGRTGKKQEAKKRFMSDEIDTLTQFLKRGPKFIPGEGVSFQNPEDNLKKLIIKQSDNSEELKRKKKEREDIGLNIRSIHDDIKNINLRLVTTQQLLASLTSIDISLLETNREKNITNLIANLNHDIARFTKKINNLNEDIRTISVDYEKLMHNVEELKEKNVALLREISNISVKVATKLVKKDNAHDYDNHEAVASVSAAASESDVVSDSDEVSDSAVASARPRHVTSFEKPQTEKWIHVEELSKKTREVYDHVFDMFNPLKNKDSADRFEEILTEKLSQVGYTFNLNVKSDNLYYEIFDDQRQDMGHLSIHSTEEGGTDEYAGRPGTKFTGAIHLVKKDSNGLIEYDHTVLYKPSIFFRKIGVHIDFCVQLKIIPPRTGLGKLILEAINEFLKTILLDYAIVPQYSKNVAGVTIQSPQKAGKSRKGRKSRKNKYIKQNKYTTKISNKLKFIKTKRKRQFKKHTKTYRR